MFELKELRTKCGFSLEEIQKLTGIDLHIYGKAEQGELILSTSQYIQLAEIFDTSMDFLLGLTDVMEPYPKKPGV